jgi:hypothetical protein
MIRYALACADGHAFESWFRNSSDYDDQARRGLVTCPVCGDVRVEKALMTPRLGRSSKSAPDHPVLDGAAVERAGLPQAGSMQAGSMQAGSGDTVAEAAGEARAPVALMSPQEVELRRKLKELRDHLVANAEHVGPRFPDEARRMHYGETEHRSIYGEASPDEVKAMLDEGIAFHPLPMLPDERN